MKLNSQKEILLTLCSASVLAVISLSWVGCQTAQESKSSPSSDKCGPLDPGAPAAADRLLDEWNHGESGADAWEPSYRDVPAMSVKSWKRLDVVIPPELKEPLQNT